MEEKKKRDHHHAAAEVLIHDARNTLLPLQRWLGQQGEEEWARRITRLRAYVDSLADALNKARES